MRYSRCCQGEIALNPSILERPGAVMFGRKLKSKIVIFL